MRQLYDHYVAAFERWENQAGSREHGSPPVFIIVCSNTNVSKLVYDFVGGWEENGADGVSVQSGRLPLFSNATDGHWNDRPNTILIDSAELESGEQMSPAFKRVARREINEFHREYRRRYPGRDTEALSDEDLLREVMNTVWKDRSPWRAHPLCRLGLDAERGLGRQHCHTHPRASAPSVHSSSASRWLVAHCGGAAMSPMQPGCSTQSTPKCMGSPSHSSPPLVCQPAPSTARYRQGSAHSRTACTPR